MWVGVVAAVQKKVGVFIKHTVHNFWRETDFIIHDRPEETGKEG